MAHWDTSALVKLSLAEADSAAFVALAATAVPLVTAFIARHEWRAVFLRREGEGALPVGEADQLYHDMLADIANGDIVEMPLTPSLEAEYGSVLRQCLLNWPPVFIRTNDALHLASAKLTGEHEFISADVRQRAAALHLGFTDHRGRRRRHGLHRSRGAILRQQRRSTTPRPRGPSMAMPR